MIAILIRTTLLLALGLTATALLRRASASLRHAVLLATIVSAAIVPFTPSLVPARFEVERPAFAMPRSAPAMLPLHVAVDSSPIPARVPWVAVVWAAGAAVALLRIALAWRAALRLRRVAIAEYGADADARVIYSDVVAAPVTIGLFRPVILLPHAMRGCTPALLHEAAHIARRDPLTRLVVQLICAAYWFQPLLWLAARRVTLEQERACDDAVLAGGTDAREYATLLLRAARGMRIAAALPMSGAQELGARIGSLFDARARRRTSRTSVATTALLALGAVLLISTVTLAAALDVDDPASEELPDVPMADLQQFATSRDRGLAEVLAAGAQRPKTWRGDLVAQRSRWALAQARNGELLVPLRERLGDSDWRVRAYAAWSLAVARDAQAVPHLIDLLDDPVWRMRAMAAFALHEIGDSRARDAMRAALDDPAWQVRSEATAYLGAIGGDEALVEQMRRDPHSAVRRAAEDSLVR